MRRVDLHRFREVGQGRVVILAVVVDEPPAVSHPDPVAIQVDGTRVVGNRGIEVAQGPVSARPPAQSVDILGINVERPVEVLDGTDRLVVLQTQSPRMIR